MLSAFKLRVLDPVLPRCNGQVGTPALGRRLSVRPPSSRRFASLAMNPQSDSSSDPSISGHFISTVGSPCALPITHWTLTHRHIHVLNIIACVAAISATWLFCCAIPTLLAFKRAAESLEKLMDVTREELPDTMAALRLSGMEISDLTMELSDLGQEITQGVRSSTRAVRVAEERLRRLTNMTPTVFMQQAAPIETRTAGPALARTARSAREGIVKGRQVVQMFFTLTRFSRMLLGYFISRVKA